jgi:hypothetical protein
VGGVERGQRNIALLNIFKLAETLAVEPSVLLEKPVNPQGAENVASVGI